MPIFRLGEEADKSALVKNIVAVLLSDEIDSQLSQSLRLRL
jgi:hypothetical protein